MLVSVLWGGLRIRLHVQVPSVQLDDVSVLDMGEDLGYWFVGVTLREEKEQQHQLSDIKICFIFRQTPLELQ